MKYIVCLPYVWKPYFDECIATCKFPRENMLLIDNTVNNIGIMKSHNLGVAKMKELGADYLIILSAAIRFGEAGGLDFIEQLEKHPELDIAHGVQLNYKEVGNKVFGWHFMAFRKEVFEKIGKWDENFTPYGFDDIDLSLRIRKGIPDVKWESLPCDVSDTTMAHSIKLAGVEAPSGPRMLYFMEKWGRHPGAWKLGSYDTPFNDPNNSLAFWPGGQGGKWDE